MNLLAASIRQTSVTGIPSHHLPLCIVCYWPVYVSSLTLSMAWVILWWLSGFKQILTLPLVFLRKVTDGIRGIGSIYWLLMSSNNKKSNSLSMSSLNSIGTFLLACWTGSTDGSNLMSYSPSKASSQLNDFGHSLWRSVTLVTVTELVCGRQILTWWWKYLCTIGFNGLFWVFSTL